MKKIDYKKNFGLLLRQLRLAEGLSQEAFADKFEINRTYYGNVERGENSISIDKMQQISIKLKTPLSELIKQAEDL
jgi:transcriptional regulator with XRE-family HTH domain